MGRAWQDRGHRVVVATGAATAEIVRSFGFAHAPLQLSQGSNPGTIRAEDQPKGEDEVLRGFFEATRDGMIPTLAYQARARLHDLMWQPVSSARAVRSIIDEVAPDEIIIDHLAYSARLAVEAAQIPYIDVVLGHPTALPLPAAGEVYGFPPAWPEAFAPAAAELHELRELCDEVSERFTREWNAVLAELAPERPPAANAFAAHGDFLVFNYPESLVSPQRRELLPPHTFVGSLLRPERHDDEVAAWLEQSDEPFVYVSFGSFLSVRGDVLARVAAALRERGLRAAIAHGSSSPEELGPLPENWLVRGFLPQLTLLERAAAAVTHGGNNSVTEALACGVPLVVLPFSTDQFAGAEALERTGLGIALAPNEASPADLAQAIGSALERGRAEPSHPAEPGPEIAYRSRRLDRRLR
nr:nucleotide disphospho-sugar-binding domain-containing protein [Leucobacter weissii]